ncbi:MAG: hypothetical protein B6I24_00660 [Bacteroidetes bacterium 4572_128]|nr:MAG: hypothetical protein B6I24_00660 [Bacteroidetes bacterium 4572_128]
MEQKKEYKFSEITYKILKEISNFDQVRSQDIFEEWFNFHYEIDVSDKKYLKGLIEANRYNISDYIEYQLLAHFISPLLHKVYFYGKNFREWFQPELSGIVNGKILKGKPDFMVASGKREPKKPFFFLQEFKKQSANSDPLSQLTAQMAVAMEINKSKEIKGAYNIGRFWFFIVLEKINDKKYQYHESKAFDCLDYEHLKQIFINLKAVKHKYCNLISNVNE